MANYSTAGQAVQQQIYQALGSRPTRERDKLTYPVVHVIITSHTWYSSTYHISVCLDPDGEGQIWALLGNYFCRATTMHENKIYVGKYEYA